MARERGNKKLKTLLEPFNDKLKESTTDELLRSYLGSIAQAQRMEWERERLLVKWEVAMRYPWYFLTEFVYTFDPQHARNEPAIKKFPDKAYLRYLTKVWTKERLLLVPKSRQLLITWLFVALYVWDAMAHFGRYIFFQSQKEDKAGFSTPLSLCSRAKFIIEHLPREIQKNNPVTIQKKPPVITFEATNSVIQGISQDSDDPRQYTASGYFSDEMAFQERAEEAITSAIPTLGITGKFVGVSSSNGQNFFYRLVHDKVEI